MEKLKQWWTDLKAVHSKVLQMVVRRLYNDRPTLAKKAKKGYNVGKLKWKGAGDYYSFEYNQTGFELKQTSDRDELHLSKIGDIPVVAHRDLPDNGTVNGVVADVRSPERSVFPLDVRGPKHYHECHGDHQQ